MALDDKGLWCENKLHVQRMSSPCECGSQKYLLISDKKKYAAEDVKSTGSEFTWPFFTYIAHKSFLQYYVIVLVVLNFRGEFP